MTGWRTERGFTLVELMVSLLIFGMLAAAGVGLLRFSVMAQASSGERLAELATQRRIVSLLTADLAQAIPRMARNEAGDPLPAFTGQGGSGGGRLLEFVRGGWENLDDAPRATLQKVEYRLEGATLQRRAYPMVDGTAPGAPATLLDDVETLKVRFRTRDGWRDVWDSVETAAMPRAVELIVKQRANPETRYVFLVGSAL